MNNLKGYGFVMVLDSGLGYLKSINSCQKRHPDLAYGSDYQVVTDPEPSSG